MQNFKKIKDLIINDEIEESLDEIDALTTEKNYEIQNAIIQIRRRVKDLKRAELSGALSFQEISQEKAKINDAILDLVNELEGLKPKPALRAMPAAAAPAAARKSPSGSKKILYMAAGAVGLVILIVIINSLSEAPASEPQGEPAQQETASPRQQAPSGAQGDDQQQQENADLQQQQESSQQPAADDQTVDTVWLEEEQVPSEQTKQ